MDRTQVLDLREAIAASGCVLKEDIGFRDSLCCRPRVKISPFEAQAYRYTLYINSVTQFYEIDNFIKANVRNLHRAAALRGENYYRGWKRPTESLGKVSGL